MNPSRLTLASALATLASGALFGYGLAVSTMIRPEVVLSFLRFQDFELMLVKGGAVLITLFAYKLARHLLGKPLLGGHFHRHVSLWTHDTAVGAALVGVGGGLCGVSPGPAIAVLGAGNLDLLWAVTGIALGTLLQGLRAKV